MSEVMIENNSANMSEVADPTETQGANEQEVAEPANEETVETLEDVTEDTENNEDDVSEQDDATNAAFAEMRRRAEEAEKARQELEEKLAKQEREHEKQSELSKAIAYARENGFSDEEINEIINEIKAEQEAEDERAAIEAENESLKEQIAALEDEKLQSEVANMAESDLRELQKIDPELKDLDDLGDEFVMLRANGISPVRAYHMINQADEATKPKGAYAPGKLNKAKQEAEYYTSDELDSMTKQEIKENWEKVQRSMERL